MAGSAHDPARLALASTLLFPISGNPIGFNHFAAAEWVLRQAPALQGVCFILGNGRHPDPTKADAEVPAKDRLRICELALEALPDPQRSFLAKQAVLAGDRLHLSSQSMQISTLEFAFDRAVRSTELIPLLRKQDPRFSGRLHWFAGADLLRRMADPVIFDNADLGLLSEQCHYHVLEREDASAQDAAQSLISVRGLALAHTAYARAGMPDWLRPFLDLSSTRIRNAAEAGDPLAGMIPQPAAEHIMAQGYYRPGRTVARLVDMDGAVLATRTALQVSLADSQRAVDSAAARLAEVMATRRSEQKPHTLSLVETTTGGRITAALAGRSGASRYFLQSRFAYDAHAKDTLLADGGAGNSDYKAVSEEMAAALAQAMRAAAGSDYAIAESGMAGPPDAGRRSLKYGLCCVAIAGPQGVQTRTLQLNPFLTRHEHQLAFAREALTFCVEFLGN